MSMSKTLSAIFLTLMFLGCNSKDPKEIMIDKAKRVVIKTFRDPKDAKFLDDKTIIKDGMVTLFLDTKHITGTDSIMRQDIFIGDEK